MKMLSEYLERAVEFERLADSETNEIFKAELLKQARPLATFSRMFRQENGQVNRGSGGIYRPSRAMMPRTIRSAIITKNKVRSTP
jgi:hypothetical protein